MPLFSRENLRTPLDQTKASRVKLEIDGNRYGSEARSLRPIVLVCGDLANLGDLALAYQSIRIARSQGRHVTVRTWGCPTLAAARQLANWGCNWVDGRNVRAFLRTVRGADLLFVGGELVRANMALRSLALLAAATALVRLSGGRIEARGLGVGQVSGVRRILWRAILSLSESVCVRDQRSLANLRTILRYPAGTLAADMAFLGDDVRRLAEPGSDYPGAIVIAPCVDISESRIADPAALAALAAAALRAHPRAPLVLACHDERAGMDPTACAYLKEASGLRGAQIFHPNGELPKLLALYREASLVITNRLHAGIFSVLFQRPVLVLEDGNPKLEVLTGNLDIPSTPGKQIGADEADRLVRAALFFDREDRASRREEMGRKALLNLRQHRIAIFNVKYSPNLGDGIIAECLEGELRRIDPHLAPVSIDLAGRTCFRNGNGRHRKFLLGLIERLPRAVRQRLVPLAIAVLVRLRLSRTYRGGLRYCHSAIIGGGALFADVDRHFPAKLAGALRACRERSLPVAVSSVGVTSNWSRQGSNLVIRHLRSVRLLSATFRDSASVTGWNELFGDLGYAKPRLAPDPGLLAAAEYGLPLKTGHREHPSVVGICVTAPVALRLHSHGGHDESHLARWIADVADDLTMQGNKAVLFTNGSPEDRRFLDDLMSGSGDHAGLHAASVFDTPADLARAISSFDCVIAHRLHACIVAYSCRTPAIGLAWDRKLEAFFAQTGRDRYLVDERRSSPRDVVELVMAAMAEGVDPHLHGRLVDWTRQEIRDLGKRLLCGGAA